MWAFIGILFSGELEEGLVWVEVRGGFLDWDLLRCSCCLMAEREILSALSISICRDCGSSLSLVVVVSDEVLISSWVGGFSLGFARG